jgi:hypothetical protein
VRFQIIHSFLFYVFLVLAHDRRRIPHLGVTAHPTAEWMAHRLREALASDSVPHYFLRDRDWIFGHDFVEQVKAIWIKQMLSAPRIAGAVVARRLAAHTLSNGMADMQTQGRERI